MIKDKKDKALKVLKMLSAYIDAVRNAVRRVIGQPVDRTKLLNISKDELLSAYIDAVKSVIGQPDDRTKLVQFLKQLPCPEIMYPYSMLLNMDMELTVVPPLAFTTDLSIPPEVKQKALEGIRGQMLHPDFGKVSLLAINWSNRTVCPLNYQTFQTLAKYGGSELIYSAGGVAVWGIDGDGKPMFTKRSRENGTCGGSSSCTVAGTLKTITFPVTPLIVGSVIPLKALMLPQVVEEMDHELGVKVEYEIDESSFELFLSSYPTMQFEAACKVYIKQATAQIISAQKNIQSGTGWKLMEAVQDMGEDPVAEFLPQSLMSEKPMAMQHLYACLRGLGLCPNDASLIVWHYLELFQLYKSLSA